MTEVSPIVFPDHAAYLKAIDFHLARAKDPADAHDKWMAGRDVLNWLYDVENIARYLHGAPEWYAIRNASTAGQTFGALIWFRGLRVHERADAKRLMWFPTSVAVKRVLDKQAGRPVEPLTQAEVRRAKGARVAVPGRWWPDLDMLANSAGQYGLDLYYDQFVAGRELAQPLIVARDFVASLGEPRLNEKAPASTP